MRSLARTTISPIAASTRSVPTTHRPKLPATPSRADGDWRLDVKASLDRAQEAAGATASMAPRTGAVRRRRGTKASQASVASTAAARAPRDCVSRMVSTSVPRAG